MMTARLVELHRVLKPTGSLYLHCDPTASHYLKVILDAVFGTDNLRNDIVWKRKAGRGETQNAARRFGVTNDNILFYARSSATPFTRQYRASNPGYVASKFTHVEEETGRTYRLDNLTSPSYRPNLVYEYKGYSPPPKGWAVSLKRMEEMDADNRLYFPTKKTQRIQRKRYLDELEGETVDSLWDDIPPINSQAKERLGYPTQKPLALLERIIAASSKEGDVVLDPFCGCGTAVDAAQKLRRQWVGIDVTYLAVDLIRKRLRHSYGEDIESTYEVHGIPTDVPGAEALFNENPFDFERWAVSLVDGQPNEKQVGDKGIDGRIRFYADKDKIGTMVVSVKGGKQIAPTMMRDLVGTVQSHKADMGLLILLAKPTRGMTELADNSGVYEVPMTGTGYPRVQIITVAELLAGKRPKMPTAILPYIQAAAKPGSEAVSLF
jgi:site-specific DNA-methyltransferase (adenine-specific)